MPVMAFTTVFIYVCVNERTVMVYIQEKQAGLLASHRVVHHLFSPWNKTTEVLRHPRCSLMHDKLSHPCKLKQVHFQCCSALQSPLLFTSIHNMEILQNYISFMLAAVQLHPSHACLTKLTEVEALWPMIGERPFRTGRNTFLLLYQNVFVILLNLHNDNNNTGVYIDLCNAL